MEFKELNDRDLEYTNGGNIFYRIGESIANVYEGAC